MSQLRVESFTISLDGFGAGPHQSIDQPLGLGGTALHGWAFATMKEARAFTISVTTNSTTPAAMAISAPFLALREIARRVRHRRKGGP